MNITVYLGSSHGNSKKYADAVTQLGKYIGGSGDTLIYGGSKSGLMGLLAQSVLEAGGKVIGVEPKFFVDAGLVYDSINELIVTQNMSERKNKMMELGDAFIALPGGTGTLEEISEVMSASALGGFHKPYVIYNLDGFYNSFLSLLDDMTKEGFISAKNRAIIKFADNITDINAIIKP